MRNYRTLNPWGHVSRAERAGRVQLARDIHHALHPTPAPSAPAKPQYADYWCAACSRKARRCPACQAQYDAALTAWQEAQS